MAGIRNATGVDRAVASSTEFDDFGALDLTDGIDMSRGAAGPDSTLLFSWKPIAKDPVAIRVSTPAISHHRFAPRVRRSFGEGAEVI